MKAIVETFNGISYFVDTKKPDAPVGRLFPDLGWVDSQFLTNKDFNLSPLTPNLAIVECKEKGFASVKVADIAAYIIWKAND